jgi:hypothetical protein
MPIESCPICDSKADALRRELANVTKVIGFAADGTKLPERKCRHLHDWLAQGRIPAWWLIWRETPCAIPPQTFRRHR